MACSRTNPIHIQYGKCPLSEKYEKKIPNQIIEVDYN